LIAELINFKNQVTQIIASKELAKEEETRLRSMIQTVDLNRQILQQQMQNLRGIIAYFKNITITSVNNFTVRLKLNLEFSTGN